jgi:hypothetical protein
MKQVWILLVVFLIVTGVGLFMKPKPKLPEGFQTAPMAAPVAAPMAHVGTTTPIASTTSQQNPILPTCITRAYYDAMGKITVEPHGIQFENAWQFMTFFNAIQKGNPSCTLPTIENYTGPIPGITGGLGTGTEPADLIALEDTNRSVMTMTEGQSINSLDDYEYNRVFLENRDRNSQTSQQQKSQAMAQYQNDWTNLPYNSDLRASYEDQFVEKRMDGGFRDPKTGVFFRNIDGSGVAPPDQDVEAIREAKILSDYQPTNLTTHQVDDETERVAKVVAQTYKNDPDWEPVVEKVAEHQYTVRELRPKRKNTEWEGEENVSIEDAQHQGLLSGSPTKAQVRIQKVDGDPYFAKDGVADYSNNRFWKYNEFNAWTPSLERMFAPTNEMQQWS